MIAIGRPGWRLVKIKRLAAVTYGLGQPPPLSDDGVPILRATNIYRGRLVREGLIFANLQDLPLGRAPLLRTGEILVVRSGAYTGDSALITQEWDGCAPGYDLRLTPRTVDARFLAYCLLSTGLQDQIQLAKSRAAQPHLNAEDLGNCLVACPALSEQLAIADYLDHETARIDALVAKKRRLIEELQERARSSVDHVIGMGSYPLWRVRHLVDKIEQGWSPQCENRLAEPGEWAVLKAGCVNGMTFRPEEHKALPVELPPRTEYLVLDGDILMSRANTRALLGSTALVENVLPQTLLCDKLYRLHPVRERVVPEYLVYCLNSAWARQQMEIEATGASDSMQNIGQDTVKNLRIPLPPYSAQNDIVLRLDRTIASAVAPIKPIQEQIVQLTERRRALITAAVTGRVDVSRVAA